MINLNLLLDMCRWQVDDEDVEVVHGAIAKPPPVFYQQACIEAMGAEFDVILGMNWLATHQVVIDCDRRRVTTYTLDVIVLHLRGISMTLTPSRVRLLVERAVDRVASKPYPGGRGEKGYGSTSGSLRE